MDARLIKEKQDYTKQALKMIEQMKPVTFKRKGNNDITLGLVAQDLQAIEELLVKKHGDGVLSIDSDQLIIILIKAIQELQAEIASLKKIKIEVSGTEIDKVLKASKRKEKI